MAISPSKASAALPPRYVLQGELRQAEHCRVEYVMQPNRPITIADLTNPKSWSHLSQVLRVGDAIDVLTPEWHARLIVRGVSQPEVYMGLVGETRFEGLPAKDAAA